MWSPHVLWRHSTNRDVAFRVVSRCYIKKHDVWSLRVEWWNVGTCHEPWSMGYTQRLRIASDRNGEWSSMELDGRVPAPKHVEWSA